MTDERYGIIRATIERRDGTWRIDVTKAFAPEHGGGEQTFTEIAATLWSAEHKLREMITVSPGSRTDL